MARFKMLPLGVDIGSMRARIALAEYDGENEIRLRAVSSRDIDVSILETPALVAALLEEMTAELGTKERRAVAVLGGAGAVLRVIRLPKMSWQERLRAARYEAQRFSGQDNVDGQTIVRVHRAAGTDGSFAVGITSKELVEERAAILRLARLKPVAIDHDAAALRRAVSLSDAILDIGAERSTLHVYSANSLFSYHSEVGGSEVTRGIARDLSIDIVSAERRKRILGAAGSGVVARDTLVQQCAALVERARSRFGVDRIALVGNGARLPGLASELEAATSAIVELPVSQLLQSSSYPEDVIRAAAPDWTLAAALTTWRVA